MIQKPLLSIYHQKVGPQGNYTPMPVGRAGVHIQAISRRISQNNLAIVIAVWKSFSKEAFWTVEDLDRV